MGNEEEASPSIPSSVDETGLKQNEVPRETQSICGERKTELTVCSVAQLRELARRPIETSRVCD
jgi:hypothetical protein